MEIPTAEAADALGVSQQRVRALISAGRVRARRVAGRWLVDAASLPSEPRRSRPMSPSSAWSFLSSDAPDARPEAAYRRRQRRDRLARDGEPERLLTSWVASRARREVFTSRHPEHVLADSRLVRSGLSDPRAGIASGDFAEAYVLVEDLDDIVRAHLLRPGRSSPNVVLHAVPRLPPDPVPPLMVAADLAEHDQPRELSRARELIREELCS
ncbi:helix-turn-helix domain-containing protein [Cellulomonas sp. SLBN-39]|uniref:helix-turn-helix domain-containing protein n=1 Tax=Cellulomonas sp. SLBN-39 TaxID=2768446 RepID=UPI001C92F336|nr:helix-turn-helix domain-containing protein [Cellulomonas sp. SLBN-39]